MQAVFSAKRSPPFASTRYEVPIILPHLQFRKVVDFLEDKWGARVVRRKNEFFRANRVERPIARLSSPDSLTLALVDQTTGGWHEVKTRIEDIQLPEPIVVEKKLYRNLLYQLARASGEGTTRWINKFYGSETGKVLGELVAVDKIRVYKTNNLFESSKIVSLEEYAAISVPGEQYFRLQDFLVGLTGGEVRRVGNEFYSTSEGKFLDSVLRSPWTVSSRAMADLNSRIVAELVSSEEVRFPDGTTKKISDLLPSRKVKRAHLYFCNSCQSFIRIPYRTSTHHSKSVNHSITYISSSITLLQISKSGPAKKVRRRFPETLYRFWGIEKGNVRREGCKKDQSRSIIDNLPIAQDTSPTKLRSAPTSLLVLAAKITVDGHLVTNEERKLAFQRLEDGMASQETSRIECHESEAKETSSLESRVSI